MKIFTKTALACAMAAGAVMASAETVEIRDSSDALLVTYSSDSVVVEGGKITLKNGDYVSGYIPGIIQGTEGYACGENTTADETNQVCIGVGGGGGPEMCGTGTTYSATLEQCIVVGPAPTLNITTNDSNLGPGQTATLTFSFSEVVTGFTASDISATNGSISQFSGSGSSYTARFTPTPEFDGTSIITVAAGSYQDVDGQNGASDTLSLVLDGIQDGTCGAVPDNVQLTDIAAFSDWGTNGSMNQFRITNNMILSSKVRTGSSPNGAAQVKLFGESATSDHRRSLWISECPGGAPIQRTTCKYPARSGTIVEITWTQKDRGSQYCDLGTNGEYYLNFSTDNTCSNGGCIARSQHYNIIPLN